MSQSDAAADRLSLRLSLHSSSLLLNLNRSRFIDDQTPVYVARHGHVVRWTDAPANQVLHLNHHHHHRYHHYQA